MLIVIQSVASLAEALCPGGFVEASDGNCYTVSDETMLQVQQTPISCNIINNMVSLSMESESFFTLFRQLSISIATTAYRRYKIFAGYNCAF